MEEKDFKLIYEDLYKIYIDTFIKEVEDLYKNCKEEGDAETFAYNDCKRLLNEKTIDLKIKRNSLSSIYRKFKNRYSLVQNNNLNRLYVKHILPECKKFKIEMNEELYENLLNELAILDASKRVSSWFSCWYNVYKMMFELNDFSEFKIIRNCNYSESSDIFKKYHRKIYPSSYIIEEKIELNKEEVKSSNIEIDFIDTSHFNNNEDHIVGDKKVNDNEKFELKEKYRSKDALRKIYNVLILTHLEDNTSFNHFYEVFTKPWNNHKSNIYFSCTTQEVSYLISELQFLGKGKGFSFAKIGRS